MRKQAEKYEKQRMSPLGRAADALGMSDRSLRRSHADYTSRQLEARALRPAGKKDVKIERISYHTLNGAAKRTKPPSGLRISWEGFSLGKVSHEHPIL